MKLDFSRDRVLAVVAHPDDAELLCAGTLARARQDGAAIGICVLCQGDKGQPNKPIRNLAAVRRKEMKAATAILGAELFLGEFADATLADGIPHRLKLVEILRQFRPTLVLAHAPEDYHADHQAASKLAEAASWSCASRGQKTKTAPQDAPPAVWFMDTINMSGFVPGFYIDISRYADVKERMLNCHKSQLARGTDGDFSPLNELMQLQFKARGMQSNVSAAEAFRQHHAFKRTQAW
ncbi:MAG: PIG-L family deacetylase [Verrucomicrobia bacterium]|nr:PIG-L family deacetylase [Verrucomicrobiota bacterium]